MWGRANDDSGAPLVATQEFNTCWRLPVTFPGTATREMGSLEPVAHMKDDASPSMEKRDLDYAVELINSQEWEELKRIIKADPNIAQVGFGKNERSSESQLLLHEVCKQQPPLDVVEVLIDANPSALKVKGQCGCTPLHWAVSYGASAEVVAKLIHSYPPGTRVRDDIHQVLPIHLASKWGVPDDVVLEILVAHPEGYFIRDGDGLTPMDYANQLRLSSDRDRMKQILSHAPLLCKVSKAAQVRVAHEQETKLRSIQESHSEQVTHWEQKYVQEKLKAKSRSQALKAELDTVTGLADAASRELEEKVGEIEKLTLKCAELEALLNKERKQCSNGLDIQKAEMQTLIDAERSKNEDLTRRLQGKETEVNQLQETIEKLESLKATLEVELKAEREVTEMMVEEVEKIQYMETLVTDTMEKVKELESKVDAGNEANEILSRKLEDEEKARQATMDNSNQTKIELESARQANADLMRALDTSNRMADLYKSRNNQIREWFKAVTEDMDAWQDGIETPSSESHVVKSTNDENFDNAAFGMEETKYDSSLETIEDRVQTPYAGVEVSLERIDDELVDDTKPPNVSPTAQYRTRISPVDEDAYHARRDIDDKIAGEGGAGGSFEEPAQSYSLGEFSTQSKQDELVQYFSTRGAVPETQTEKYTVSTVDDDSVG